MKTHDDFTPSRQRLMRLSSVLALALFIAACTTSPTGRQQLMIVSPQQAVNASREAYAQTVADLAKEGKISQNRRLNARVQRITDRLVDEAIRLYPETASWEWTVKVIDEPDTINAWCMAGGKMAIYTGLLQQLDATDDEVAQVMGHEIAHAVANHTAEKMSMAMMSQVGLVGVALATRDSSFSSTALSGASAAAALAVTLPHSRTAEIEADRIGIELAARAGYHPEAAISLWQKMAKVGGRGVPEFLSTHPSPANRQQVLAALVPEMMPLYRANRRR